MGGIGSGRHWHYDSKDTTNQYRTLDVRRLQQERMLMAGLSFRWQWTQQGNVVASIQIRVEAERMILSYRHRRNEGDWKDEEYPVWLDWTPCTYGGQRAWFRCPALGCGRRVAILYGGSIFACRHCYRLAYPCQREKSDDRARRRAEKIRERLGWEPGIINFKGGKPKRMRWHTFKRLSLKHDIFVNVSLSELVRRWGPLSESRFCLLK